MSRMNPALFGQHVRGSPMINQRASSFEMHSLAKSSYDTLLPNRAPMSTLDFNCNAKG